MKKTWIKVVAAVFFLVSFVVITQKNLPWIYSSIGPDFTQVWISAKDLVASKEPYLDPNLNYPNAYPPISVIFFMPLAFLSHQMALVLFTYVSFASIVSSVFLSLKIAMKEVPWYYFLMFLGLSFASFPIRFSLGMGQVNIIVLFLLLLSVFLETGKSKNSLLAGLSLGVAIALKPIFAFFLIFFALKKSWRLVFVSSFFVALLTAITLIFWPLQIWINWYQSSIAPLTNFTSPFLYVYQNQGLFGFVSRYIGNFDVRIYITKIVTFIIVPIACYLALKRKEVDLGLSFFIITLLLFDITSWQHHFVWLMFPFVVLFVHILKSKKTILLGVLLFAYLLISGNLKNPYTYPVILQENQFFGTAILWAINFYFLNDWEPGVVKEKISGIENKVFELLDFK